MRKTYSFQGKVRQFLIILFPILITQLSLMATGFFDTVMSGKASPVDLAGVAIGVNLWVPASAGLSGVIMGITPILAQLYGAGRKGEIPYIVVQGTYLAAAMAAAVIAVGVVAVPPLLGVMQLEPGVHRVARGFLTALAFGIPPLFVSGILRNFIDSLGYTRVTMVVTLLTVPLNIALNYLLIFGKFGFPRLGGVGAGYGTAVTYWCILLITAAVVHKVPPFRDYQILRRFCPVSLAAWKGQLRVGAPIGAAVFCEVSIFGAVTILMAEFGTVTIAAHQAAINFASVVYMLPLSIGMALAIVIGFEVGAKRYDDARLYSRLGLGIAVAAAVIFALLLLAYSERIAGFYTDEADLRRLIQSFLVYAIFFQLSDAVAAPIQGALRGYKDVKVTFLMAVLSYWVIGMPVGYWLAKFTAWGPYGYWIGFIVGLAVGAVVLLLRLTRLQRRLAERICPNIPS